MCKVYEFPAKNKLPKELEERLQKSAVEYVLLLNDIVEYMEDNGADEKELFGVLENMMNVYLGTIDEVIKEL